MREHLIEIQQLSGNRLYTLQQDGATSHTAHATITFIEQSVPDYIEKDNWPSNSCDLNPLDYSIWGVMDQRVYKDIRVFETVNELKAKVQEEWDSLSQRLINQAVDHWRSRLQKVVEEEGGFVLCVILLNWLSYVKFLFYFLLLKVRHAISSPKISNKLKTNKF